MGRFSHHLSRIHYHLKSQCLESTSFLAILVCEDDDNTTILDFFESSKVLVRATPWPSAVYPAFSLFFCSTGNRVQPLDLCR
jgi:hypothetical protein